MIPAIRKRETMLGVSSISFLIIYSFDLVLIFYHYILYSILAINILLRNELSLIHFRGIAKKSRGIINQSIFDANREK